METTLVEVDEVFKSPVGVVFSQSGTTERESKKMLTNCT